LPRHGLPVRALFGPAFRAAPLTVFDAMALAVVDLAVRG